MNAIKFIKEHGVEKARKHYLDIREAANQVSFVHACEPFASQLNRLIESVDLVNQQGSLRTAKQITWVDNNPRLVQAIADYEAIYSNYCEILDYPEDYTSPNCKKYDERVK